MSKYLTNVSTAIGILLGFHYFISFRWLQGFFDKYDLDGYDIISLEDLTFPFGDSNLQIFGLSMMGLIWIIGCHLIFTNEEEERMFREKASEDAKKLSKRVKNKKSTLIALLVVSVIAIPFTISQLGGIKNFVEDETQSFYLLLTFIIPFAYVIFIEKRKAFLYMFFGTAFFWVNIFVGEVLDGIEVGKDSKTDKISLFRIEYSDKIYTSTKQDKLVYAGYRYWVFKNESSGEVNFIPTKEIKHSTKFLLPVTAENN
ncbi:MAG: hypothetical protein ABJF04_09230 [Reichenbachiella sp.]|uniref:hypothetical protein n=1 Tax=Reichenbachiella sp. TaxID=2184521 RepID=UPI0032630168